MFKVDSAATSSATMAPKVEKEEEHVLADDRPRGLRIAMMGDSLMRYQYLSLAYFLRNGQWFDPTIRDHHLTHERSFDSWNDFYNHTNWLMSPLEYCDCFRAEEQKADNIIENRYFYDPLYDNSLVFITAFGHFHPVHGRVRPHDVVEKQEKQRNANRHQLVFQHPMVNNGTHRTSYLWEATDWSWVVRNHLAHLNPRPTHLVFNSGMWPSSFNDNQTACDELVRTVESLNMTFIWRETIVPANHRLKRGNRKADNLMCGGHSGVCLNVAWTANLRSDLYWDPVHLFEPAYRSINEDLMKRIGYNVSDRVDRTTLFENSRNRG